MQRPNPGTVLVLLALLLAAGCATTPSDEEYSSLPPAPQHPPGQTAEALDAPWNQPSYATGGQGSLQPVQDDLLERIRAGYRLPRVQNSRIDSELQAYVSRPDYLDRTFRRGTRYLYYIMSEIDRRGMPAELALLPVVESAFNPVAYSRSRAAGLWQFIPSTGKHYGLEQNWWLDERRDVLKSTNAALDYLQYLHRYFKGDWLLAVAAYNGGEGTVSKAVRHNAARGRPTDFFSLKKLRAETRNYVPKLLAISRIVANPQAYGLQFGSIPNRPYFSVIDPGRQVHLGEAAKLAGISSNDMFALNPAFNRMTTPPKGPHRLLLPVNSAETYRQAMLSGRDTGTAPAGEPEVVLGHRVRRGESLSTIASRYGVSVAALRDENQLGTTVIHPGQKLVIPGRTASIPARPGISNQLPEAQRARSSSSSRAGVHKVRRGDTLWGVARRYGISVPALASANGLTAASTIKVGQPLKIPSSGGSTKSAGPESTRVTYKVRRGDTLSQIALKFDVSVRQLMAWNDIRRSNSLRAGQRLVVYVDAGRASGG